MRLPTEILCQVVREIIDTPAVFVFDLVIAKRPHPPLLPQSSHIRFRPVVNPPTGEHEYRSYPGTYESQISKTIRALLLTNKSIRAECLKYLQGISVPTVSKHAIVRFNPREHVVCIQSINFSRHQSQSRRPESLPAPWMSWSSVPTFYWTSWTKRDSDMLTDLDFDIHHLAFMAYAPGADVRALTTLRMIFPSIQHISVVVAEQPRRNPSAPIDLICPASDERHTMSAVYIYMLKPFWNCMKGRLSFKNTILTWSDRGMYHSMEDPVFEELVLL